MIKVLMFIMELNEGLIFVFYRYFKVIGNEIKFKLIDNFFKYRVYL